MTIRETTQKKRLSTLNGKSDPWSFWGQDELPISTAKMQGTVSWPAKKGYLDPRPSPTDEQLPKLTWVLTNGPHLGNYDVQGSWSWKPTRNRTPFQGFLSTPHLRTWRHVSACSAKPPWGPCSLKLPDGLLEPRRDGGRSFLGEPKKWLLWASL